MKKLAQTAAILCLATSLFAQEETNSVPPFGFQQGPVTGELANISILTLPEGYAFTGPEGAKEFLAYNGNIVSDVEIGAVVASNGWWAVFQFEDIGYVKDDEKLDSDQILKTKRENLKQGNEQRRAQQLDELEIVGWYKEPFYNDQTQNLEWCTELRVCGETNTFVNYNINILGRYGVTEIILVADIDQLDTAIPELASLLGSYEYNDGKKYTEYRQGDKIAKYGLTALVAGGAAAVALKSGLLKPLLKGLAFVGIAIAGFFKKLFGKNK